MGKPIPTPCPPTPNRKSGERSASAPKLRSRAGQQSVERFGVWIYAKKKALLLFRRAFLRLALLCYLVREHRLAVPTRDPRPFSRPRRGPIGAECYRTAVRVV